MGALSKPHVPVKPGGGNLFSVLVGSKAQRKRLITVMLGVFGFGFLSKLWRSHRSKKEREKNAPIFATDAIKNLKKRKVGVNNVFFKRISHLLGILIPGTFTMESFFLVLVAGMLVTRTYCDVWMLQNSTAVERSIITRDPKAFIENLFQFITAVLPIAIINALLKFGLHELALRFRTRLSKHLFKEYMKGFTFYKISNLDNRISNPDQLLTQDVDKFCQSVADLYSNLSKPILDIIIYSKQLAGSHGKVAPLSMMGYLAVTGLFLTRMRRPLARFTVREQKLEGEFRYVNSRLLAHSEEVAFYVGNKRESNIIGITFDRLVEHLRTAIQFRFATGVIDSIFAKYCAMVVGYLIISRPFMDPNNARLNALPASQLMEDYYRKGRMLMNLSQAIGRVVLAGRELTRLAGFTERVTDLENVLAQLNKGEYKRTMVSEDAADAAIAAGEIAPNKGTIVAKDNVINFDQVPIVTPNGDVLIRALSFQVKSGENTLICGPNGSGKSSLFRVLGELWPIWGGVLTKPKRDELFYIPQKPYLTLGSLRDQIIYPHTLDDCRRNGVSDAELMTQMREVSLEYVVEREGGWDAIADWADVLSGGEKQRIAMARLFYHKPQFAILDECTSAVSVDVEGHMYARAREEGITLFTVSHRKSLWKYHEYKLFLTGRGDYTFEKIDHENMDDAFGS